MKDRDPKYVIPGTYTPLKKKSINAMPSSKAADNAKDNAEKKVDLRKNAVKVVVAKAGDTLSKIAKDNGTTVKKIVELNKDTMQDPNKLSIGQRIRVK